MNKLPLAPQDHNPDPTMAPCARRGGHLAGPWTPQHHKICRSELAAGAAAYTGPEGHRAYGREAVAAPRSQPAAGIGSEVCTQAVRNLFALRT
jgi:hypothetical protein